MMMFLKDYQQFICIVEVAGPVVLAVMTISEVAGVVICCG